jgi:SAM-dependent methyltransferase
VRELLVNVAKLYSDNVKAFGATARSAGWKDEASQRLRFQKLLEVIEGGKGAELTINDLGCGYGAFYRYLRTRASLRVVNYYGYDISEEMLTLARKSIRSKTAIFTNSEQILYEADYSVASGIFNVKLNIEDSSWENYIRETLFNMNEKSIKGFAFNALTTYVDYKESYLYYVDPLFLFDFCKKNFSKKVSLLHDYGLYEWTIIVRR